MIFEIMMIVCVVAMIGVFVWVAFAKDEEGPEVGDRRTEIGKKVEPVMWEDNLK